MDKPVSPIIFGEWLKCRRKALDMTQSELAQRAGCSVGALRKIEVGERKPSKQLAGLLAKALEIADEDQPTFIRAARGDLNLARLGQPSAGISRQLPEVARLQPGQPGAMPAPAADLPAPLHRIPVQFTPLIGREAEIAALERLFNDPQCRLLTLTGMGGIGKTRLAIEFAERKKADFPGGVFYIPLTSVNSPEKVVPAIADVLGFTFSGSVDPKEQLLYSMTSSIRQETLLIFDNLEHLLVQAANQDRFGVVELTAEILQRLPNIKILGTSRERLNLHGEWTYELYGLSVPPARFAGPLEAYDAITLFVKSAQRLQMDFQVPASDQPALVQIARLVEGVPLAIELAAAWVGLLTVPEIEREIQSSLDFLTTSMRDIPERHRSIRATFDHSWKLLPEAERRALSQLAVFQGGFDREAAWQIAGATLPLLASLNAKSLVRRASSGRYDLHEVIRQYALSHLAEHPQNLETHTRHCAYYLTLVQERAGLLKSGSQQETIRELTGEIDNIRAAWVWAIEHQQFDLLGQAGRGFGWYFEITGLYREGIEQLELLVQALKTAPQDVQQGRILGLALIHQALLHFRKGDFDHARMLYEEAVNNLRLVGDQSLLADSLAFLGTILYLQGEYERARMLMEEAYVYARQYQEHWLEAWAIFNLGHIDSMVGFYGHGYEQMQAGIAAWRVLGDPQSIALGLNFLVPTLIKLGRFEEAKTLMRESIALCEQSKNRWGMGTAYRYLGVACIAGGEFSEAEAHLLKSLEIFGEFSQGWDIARSLAYLGDVAWLTSDLPRARAYYLDALQHAVRANALPIALDALFGLASLQSQAGEVEQSLLLCHAILNHPSSEEDTKVRTEQLRASLEKMLSSSQIERARLQAREKPFDLLVREVLKLA